jgi:hypothetical protein
VIIEETNEEREVLQMKNKHKTITGTNIDEVKKLNAKSGLSYNEAKILLAQKRGFIHSKDES